MMCQLRLRALARRVALLLAALAAFGVAAFAQYGYTSTSLSATSDTVYASTYVEVDYDTAQYYYVQSWNELDQNCNYSCDYTVSGVAGGWSYGSSSASWYASTPLGNSYYTVWAESDVVVAYSYYNYDYDETFYEDEYGYSLLGDSDATPSYYEAAPSVYEEIVYDVIPLDFAYSVIDSTTNWPSIGALQLYSGDPVPGGSGYLVAYGSDLQDIWASTSVSASAGVSASITFQSPDQINIAYTIDSSVGPGNVTITLWTAVGNSSANLTIYPAGSPWVSEDGLSNIVLSQVEDPDGTWEFLMGYNDYIDLYGNSQEYFQSCGCQDIDNVLGAWAHSVAVADQKLIVDYTLSVIRIMQWIGIINQQRTPILGNPGSVVSFPKPGGKTVRVYGQDGRAVRDIDYGSQAHSGNDPEVHDWDWSSGKPQRSTPGRAPQPGDIPPGY